MERERGPLVSLIWTVGMRRKKSQTWTTCLSNMVGCPVKIFDINKILSCHNSMIANFYAPKSTLPRNQMPHHAKSLVGPTCLTSSPRTPPTYPIMRGWYLQTEDIRPFKLLILMGLWCMAYIWKLWKLGTSQPSVLQSYFLSCNIWNFQDFSNPWWDPPCEPSRSWNFGPLNVQKL